MMRREKIKLVGFGFLCILSLLVAVLVANPNLRLKVSGRAASADLATYWPMNLDNWWVYKTTAPSTCNNPAGEPAKTAWWVMPPDTSERDISSRILSMYKEAACTWNWTNEAVNIRWSIPLPKNDSNGLPWFIHQGALTIKSDPNKLLSSLPVSVRPPFVTSGSFFADDLGGPTDSLSIVRFAARKKVDPVYPAYSFFPYTSPFPHNMDYPVGFNCGGNGSSANGNWSFYQGLVPEKCHVPTPGQEIVGKWLMRYTENVPVTVQTKTGPKVYSALQAHVFEPTNVWGTAACERYSFVKNLGPVRIESALMYMLTEAQFNQHKQAGQLAQVLQLSVLPGKTPQQMTYSDYLQATFENRCLNFDYRESEVDLSGNISSPKNEIYVKSVPYDSISNLIDKKIFLSWYSVIDLFDYRVKPIIPPYTFNDFDSPDSMAVTKSYAETVGYENVKEMFYAKDGKYWQYNANEGRLMAYGNLSDVWGPSGSNAPGVNVNGSIIYPWSNGGPTSVVFASGIKQMFGQAGLYINHGAYWLWGYCTAAEKMASPGCVGRWRKSGLVTSLFKGIPTTLTISGRKITPFSNGGPRVVSESWWTPQGLDIYNEGGWWFYDTNRWTKASLISSTDLGTAPKIQGVTLTSPETATLGQIFRDSNQLRLYGNSAITNPIQRIYSQSGRYWVRYAGGGWETW